MCSGAGGISTPTHVVVGIAKKWLQDAIAFDLVVFSTYSISNFKNPRSGPSLLYLAMAMFFCCYLVESIARIYSDLLFRVKI